ncbi:MAG TPA: pyridoxal-phosphate dependent enzyme [Longimicrobiaceae bacterium]|nr:pyridoxal-phosphate dependent enzyme [Longimicrobiaceae bacterium]
MQTPPVSPRLSLERIEEAAREIDPVFLDTPQFLAEPLTERLGCELVVKVETVNPIRSFKGRGADFFVRGLGRGEPLVCASAGNFGQGLAYAARARGIPLTVFAATTANPLKVERMRALGAEVRLSGSDFDAAKAAARDFAEQEGVRFLEDGREPAISEGAGTIGVELARWPDGLDTVLVPLGNGALLAGVGHWLRAHRPEVRIVGVCASGAPAMERSWRSGAVVETERADTIADGIAVRVPVPEALATLEGVVDDVLLVDDPTTVEAMRLVFDGLGLLVEPAGAAGVAAALAHGERFAGERVATVLCGANLTAAQVREWLIPA